jgi:hypothetical protein
MENNGKTALPFLQFALHEMGPILANLQFSKSALDNFGEENGSNFLHGDKKADSRI